MEYAAGLETLLVKSLDDLFMLLTREFLVECTYVSQQKNDALSDFPGFLGAGSGCQVCASAASPA